MLIDVITRWGIPVVATASPTVAASIAVGVVQRQAVEGGQSSRRYGTSIRL